MHPRLPAARLRLSLLALALVAAAPGLAQAQTAPAAASARGYDIPAQPLGSTLTRIAAESGAAISVDAELVRGIAAGAVRGQFTAAQAVQAAVAGTGLALARTGSGALTVVRATPVVPAAEPAPPGQGGALPTVTVSGKAPGAMTEGTGSYATRSSSSSTRLNLTPQETPQSLTVLTRQQLDDRRASTLNEAMDVVPGVIVAKIGVGDESYGYYARGFEMANFEVDGVPTDAGLNLFNQNLAIYDRVEIVRGATGLISGLGNPAATVNLIRKRPTLQPQASVSVEAGNWNRRGAAVDASGNLNADGSVRGRVVADVRTQKGWIDRYEQQAATLYGIAEADLGDATLLTVGINHQRSDNTAPLRSGLPAVFADGTRTNLARSTNAAPRWSYNDQHTSGVFASLEHAWDNGWTGKAEYSYTQTRYDSVFAYARGTLQSDGSGITLLPTRWAGKPAQHNLDLYLTGNFALFGRTHELIGGLTLSRYKTSGPSHGGYLYSYASSPAGAIADLFDSDGSNPATSFAVSGGSSTTTRNDAAYLSSRLHVSDALKLIVGGRFVRWHRDVRSWSTGGSASQVLSDENVLVPYAGAVFDLNPQWAVYASMTKIFNPQGQWVRDANNNGIAPLDGRGLEAGLKGSHLGGRLNTSAALFHTRQDNLAVWQPGGFYVAAQSTTSKGVELEAHGELAPGWQIATGFTHTRTIDAAGAAINTFLPRNSLKLYTSYRLPGTLNGLTLGGGLRWQGRTGTGSVWQGGYAVASLTARYAIDRHLSLSLNVDNLFDRRYFSYMAAYAHYGAPRSVVAGLQYRF